MNSIARNQFASLHETTALRDAMLQILTDTDLEYRLPGANVSLGELCRRMGQVEQSYIEAFKTFRQTFDYPPAEAGIERSVQRLGEWFKTLDSELESALSALSEEDIQQKIIERGFKARVMTEFQIYRESLLIFCGKASIYLNALNKPLNTQWQDWIA